MNKKKITPYRNFIPGNDIFSAIKNLSRTLVAPLIVASISLLIWYILRINDIHYQKDSEFVITAVLTFLIFVYGFKAHIQLGTCWAEYKAMSACIIKSDLQGFLLLRDEMIPRKLHMMAGIMAFFILLHIVLFDYGTDILAGVIAIFSASFVLTQFVVVVIEIDDPIHKGWFKMKIPPYWLVIKVDDYFKNPTSATAAAKKITGEK